MRVKKIIALFMILAVIQLLFVGCGIIRNNPVFSEYEEKQNKEEINQTDDSENITEPSGFTTPYAIEDEKDGYYIVSKLGGSLYGLIDSNGIEILNVEYDSISFPESEKANAVIVELEGEYGLYSYDGAELLPAEYENILNSGKYSELYLVEKDEKQSIVGLDGKMVQELSGAYDRLVGDCYLTMCKGYNGYEKFFTDVYNLKEEVLFAGGESIGDAGLAFEIKDANNIMGIYHPRGDSLYGRDDEPDSTISLVDSNWNTMLSYTFPYDGSLEYEHISSYAISNDGKWISLHYPRSGLAESSVLYNVDTQEVSDENYLDFIRVDKDTFFGRRLENGHVYRIDIFDNTGKIKESIESIQAQNIPILEGNAMVLSQKGETYRIYNKDGDLLTDERYLSAELVGNFAIVQNLDGEYGILDDSGKMRVPFGEIKDGNRYEGREWTAIYAVEDSLCIVTRDGEGSIVSVF